MTIPTGANLYAGSVGTHPETVELPHYSTRIPNVRDINFPIGKRWIVTVVGSEAEYVLLSVSTAGGGLPSANWSVLGTNGGALNTINSLTPSANNIDVVGTSNQIAVNNSGSTVTLSTPSTFVAPGSVAATTTVTATLGAITATNGNLVLGTAGNKINSTSVGTTTTAGANAFGSVTLVGGTATVSTTAVTTNSLIILWRQTIGATGAAALGELCHGTIVNATSFVINAASVSSATTLATTDVSVVGYMIIN